MPPQAIPAGIHEQAKVGTFPRMGWGSFVGEGSPTPLSPHRMNQAHVRANSNNKRVGSDPIPACTTGCPHTYTSGFHHCHCASATPDEQICDANLPHFYQNRTSMLSQLSSRYPVVLRTILSSFLVRHLHTASYTCGAQCSALRHKAAAGIPTND